METHFQTLNNTNMTSQNRDTDDIAANEMYENHLNITNNAETEQKYIPHYSQLYRVGFFSTDRSSQTDLSDIVNVKEMIVVVNSLLKDMVDMRRKLSIARQATVAHYTNQIEQKSSELYSRITTRLYDLESFHKKKVEMIRRAYRQQLDDALSKLRQIYKDQMSKQLKKMYKNIISRTDDGQVDQLKEAIFKSDTVINLLKIQLESSRIKTKEQQLRIIIDDLTSQNKKLDNTVKQLEEDMDEKNEHIAELSRKYTGEKAELERCRYELNKIKSALSPDSKPQTLERSRSPSFQHLNDGSFPPIKKRVTLFGEDTVSRQSLDYKQSEKARQRISVSLDRRSTQDAQDLNLLTVSSMSFGQEALAADHPKSVYDSESNVPLVDMDTDKDKPHQTPIPSLYVEEAEEDAAIKQPPTKKKAKLKSSLKRKKSPIHTAIDSKQQTDLSLKITKLENQLKAEEKKKSDEVETLHTYYQAQIKALTDELDKASRTMQPSPIVLQSMESLVSHSSLFNQNNGPEGNFSTSDLPYVQFLENENQRLKKEISRLNDVWERKFEILQQSMRALKDESYLRNTLEIRATSVRPHVNVNFKTACGLKSISGRSMSVGPVHYPKIVQPLKPLPPSPQSLKDDSLTDFTEYMSSDIHPLPLPPRDYDEVSNTLSV